MGVILPRKRHFAMFKDSFDCHRLERGMITRNWWVETRDTAKYAIIHRTPPFSHNEILFDPICQ